MLPSDLRLNFIGSLGSVRAPLKCLTTLHFQVLCHTHTLFKLIKGQIMQGKAIAFHCDIRSMSRKCNTTLDGKLGPEEETSKEVCLKDGL